MSDLETRLTEALRGGSESAPDAVGLADAARSRARVRRRTQLASAGLVAVAALAVAVTVVALGGDSDRGKAPVAENTTVSDLEPVAIGRWESWHGVTVLVPEDWEYGDQSAWCADGGSVETFRVTRPGGAVPMIACTPSSSYGLTFQEIDDSEPFDWPVVTQTGDAWPPDTFVGARGENGVLVTVAGPDREQVVEVLSTVGSVNAVDPNGCSLRAGDDGRPAREMSVCRYDTVGLLEQSERLDAEETAQAQRAVLDSPPLSNGQCEVAPDQSQVVHLLAERFSVEISLGSPCFAIPDSLGDVDDRELTEELLFWALSPGWSGPFYAGVPIPEELRD